MFLAITLFTFIASVASQLLLPTEAGLTSDAHCGNGYCVTAWYSPSTKVVTYVLVVPQGGNGPIGWRGFAQGTGMFGANMAICWVNADKTLTVSHRGANGEREPQTSLAPDTHTFAVNAFGKTEAGKTVWSWNMSLPANDAQNAVQHIFAMNDVVGPTTNDVNAELRKHTFHEHGIALDLTKPYDGSVPKGLTDADVTKAVNAPSTETTATKTSASENNGANVQAAINSTTDATPTNGTVTSITTIVPAPSSNATSAPSSSQHVNRSDSPLYVHASVLLLSVLAFVVAALA